MATATRIPQDRKRIVTTEHVEEITRTVTDRKGVIISSKITDVRIVPAECLTYVDQPDRVRLEMSVDEAETLCVIARVVGGNDITSRRRDVDAIYKALNGAGVDAQRAPSNESWPSPYAHPKYGLPKNQSLHFETTDDSASHSVDSAPPSQGSAGCNTKAADTAYGGAASPWYDQKAKR